jgi:hypothetical protein
MEAPVLIARIRVLLKCKFVVVQGKSRIRRAIHPRQTLQCPSEDATETNKEKGRVNNRIMNILDLGDLRVAIRELAGQSIPEVCSIVGREEGRDVIATRTIYSGQVIPALDKLHSKTSITTRRLTEYPLQK